MVIENLLYTDDLRLKENKPISTKISMQTTY